MVNLKTLIIVPVCLSLIGGAAPALAGHDIVRDLSADAIATPASPETASVGGAIISIASLSGARVEEGQTVRFKITANRDGYAHLYVKSASGRLQLWMENVPVNADETLRYPLDDALEIKATAPAGRDKVVAIFTERRLPGFAGSQTTRMPIDLDMSEGEFSKEMELKLAKSGASWGWSRADVRVSE